MKLYAQLIKSILFIYSLKKSVYGQENPDGSFNPKYEPYSTLLAEQKYLKRYVAMKAWTTEEQDKMPNCEVIAIKLWLLNWNVTNRYALEKDIKMQAEVVKLFELEIEILRGKINLNVHYKLTSIKHIDGKLLIGFYLQPHNEEDINKIERLVRDRVFNREEFKYLIVHEATVQILKPLMKDTVIEVFIQLYKVKYEFGMDHPDSIIRRNMTDQMIHLIGTRFEKTFGEYYYRIVIMDFHRSKNSMIVRAAVLLDPNKDNLYHASNIWQSLFGYIRLGPFPLLAENVQIISSYMVKKEFHKYLADRSYKRPLSIEFAANPLISITIPSFVVIMCIIIVIIICIRVLHWFAYERNAVKRSSDSWINI